MNPGFVCVFGLLTAGAHVRRTARRHILGVAGLSVDLAREAPFRVGNLAVDPSTRLVTSDAGVTQLLEPRVMQVLVTLAHADGLFLSRQDLVAACWGGRALSDDAVDRVIAAIRRLGQGIGASSFAVETVAKVGYRLTPSASRVGPAADAGTRATEPSRRRLLLFGGGAVVAAALGVAASRWRSGRPARGEALSIAVLPFEDLSPTEANPRLARGLAREIRNSLARVAGLRVISESSSFGLAAESLDATQLGRRLGASILVEGNIFRAPGALRLGVQLVDAANGAVLWSTTHREASGDLFQAQEAVTALMIQELSGRIGPESVATRPPGRRRDPVAFRRVVEAQQLAEESRALRMRGQTEPALDVADLAWTLANEALAIDRQDVGALLVAATLIRNGWPRALAAQPLTAIQRATEAVGYVRRALVADPNDPAALAALGDHYRRYEWRWEEAGNLLRRALATDPSLADAHWSYAYMRGTMGYALEGLEHAQILFRLDPETAWRRTALPRLLYVAGRRSAALGHYARELATTPDNLFLIRELYFMYLSEGEGAALRGLIDQVTQLWRGRPMPPGVTSLLARSEAGIAALGGQPAALIAMVDADVAAFDAPRAGAAATQQGRASVDLLFVYAMEYGWAGRTVRALDLLERALAARSLYWPATLPFGRAEFPPSVRAHPRYRALWSSEPRLLELVRSRRRAVEERQQYGTLPDGRRVRPPGYID